MSVIPLVTPVLVAENTNRVEQAPRMKEVVVSASRFEEESWKSGSALSIVPESRVLFERRFEALEYLRGEPGVIVNNGNSVPGGVSQISIRGLPFSRTLIQVDGLRFNRTLDGIANLTDLPPLLTGSMEILRGPQSSFYGSEAEGGVLAVQSPAGKGKPSFGASFEGGTFDTRQEKIFSQGKMKFFDWNAAVSRLDTDNARPNNGFRQDAAAIRLGYDFGSDLRLDLSGRFSDFTAGSPNGITGSLGNDPNDRLIRRMRLLTPSVTARFTEEWESKLTLGYIGVGQRFDSPPDQFLNDSQSLQAAWQNTLRGVDWNTLVATVEGRSERTTTGGSSGPNVFNRAVEAISLSDSLRPTEEWGLTLSGRYDHHEGYDNVWTYRASQVYQLPFWSSRLHASFGTAFRSPTVSELEPLFGPGSGNNPSLQPETSEGYDAGLTAPLMDDALEMDGTYFYNNVVNLIALDSSFTVQNLSEARTEGVETSLRWKVSNEWDVKASFTLTSTTSKDGASSGNDLARIPRQMGRLLVHWQPIKPLRASLIWNFSGTTFDGIANTQEIKDAHKIDLVAEYRLSDQFRIYGRAENLVGYRFQQVAGFPSLGRTLLAGLEFQY